MKKYYAVRNGMKVGIFTSWEECKKSVLGYPGAVYKSFANIEDAKSFLGNVDNVKGKITDADIEAYIDGSYDDTLKRYSYGVIIFFNGKRYEYSNSDNDENLVELRNVAGELLAAMYVMKFALRKEVKRINIYYDYQGIEMWATGNWKANLPFTKEYSDFSKMIMSKLKVNFIKIKSHSGNKYNDEVDLLAKKALHIDEMPHVDEFLNNQDVLNDIDVFSNNDIPKKKGIVIEQFYHSGQIICLKEVIKEVKIQWKKQKRLLKEIKEYQSYFDIDRGEFVIKIYTEKDETIMRIKGEKNNGKK